MRWALADRGFLPNHDPLERIPDREFNLVEQRARDLPGLVDQGRFQEYMADSPLFESNFSLTEFLETESPAAMERAFMLFSYFASAIVHARDNRGVKHDRIPSCIARPLLRLSKAVGRPPILAYASYCLHNWRRINKEQPIELGNIELLQNFTIQYKKDEDWFILVHVDIEAKAHEALAAIAEDKHEWDAETHLRRLNCIHGSLVRMNGTLDRMPEGCRPEVYFSRVRPYIFGFNGVVYEGCFDNEPQNYRGETGAQSSVIPSLISYLGIQHKDSMLTQHLEDMRRYMPGEHVKFIRACHNIRHPVYHNFQQMSPKAKEAADAYNACVEQVIRFRQTHFKYAVDYIEKRVSNPIATGGTPYVKWLGQLIEETREFFIKQT